KVNLGLQEEFSLGNLHAMRDWGFAGDYVKAMHLMLQRDTPEDYVIATGITHSVKEFVEIAAQVLGIIVHWSGTSFEEIGSDANGRTIVRINGRLYRPAEVNSMRGDYSKARRQLGWTPQVSFTQLIEMMVKADFEQLRARIAGYDPSFS